MKNPKSKNIRTTLLIQLRWKTSTVSAFILTVLLLLCFTPAAFSSTPYYADFNGSVSGFGTPVSGDTETSAIWSTSAAGTATPAAFPTGTTGYNDAFTFGATAGDTTLQGTFSLGTSGSIDFGGITVNSTGLNITWTGTGNYAPKSGTTWYVNTGSTLTMSIIKSSGGMNFNNASITFTGGGTYNSGTGLGGNDSAILINNMVGGVMNLQATNLSASGYVSTFSGGFTQQAGTLNFASAQSAYCFEDFSVGKTFSILGGTIDNTSGSPLTLSITNGGSISIGGSFNFAGSGNLDFGPNPVTLTTTPTVTVAGGQLAMSGVVSGGGLGLIKSGGGTLALNNANTYSGNTTINAGTLALGASGSLSNSPVINVATGTFDVSQATGYTLVGSQILKGVGTVNGSVVTANGSEIFPATDGLTGTLAFNNNLDMSGGGTAAFDLGATAAGANDLITVGGTLTLNGNSFHIKATSLETANDYVLFSSANPVSGTVNATPIFDVAPANFGSYSVKISGNNVVLHYAASSITFTSTAMPSGVDRNQSVFLSTTPSSGTAPYTVTVDASSLGGSSTLLLVSNGAGAYTNTVIVTTAGTLGVKALPITATDSASHNGSSAFSVTVVGSNLAWIGNVSDNWNFTDQNWLNGAVVDYYLDGDNVVFNDTLAGTGNVVLTGVLTPGSLTVSNSAQIYTFSGSGSLNSGIIKSNNGTLVLNESGPIIGNLTANGGTVILDQSGIITGNTIIKSGGNVQLGNNDSGGSFPTGTITDNGNLTFYLNNSFTNNLVIAGAGEVTQIGTNILTMNASLPAFNGNLVVANGIMEAASSAAVSGGALGTASATTVITNQGTFENNGIQFANIASLPSLVVSGTGFNNAGAIINSASQNIHAFTNITVAGDVYLGGMNRWDLRASVGTAASLNSTPPGSAYKITKVGPNQISLVSVGKIDAGLGDVDIQQGVLSIETTTAQFGNSTNTITVFSNAVLDVAYLASLNKHVDLKDGANYSVFASNGTNCGPITLQGNDTFNVTGALIATNVLSGSGSVNVTGGGKLMLSASNTYNGATYISAGTLAITGGGSINYTPVISVGNGAILDTSGMILPLTLSANQTMSNSAASTATLNGSVNTGLGAVSISYDPNSSPAFTIANGTLTLSGATSFVVDNTGPALNFGSYKIISAGSVGLVAGTLPPVTVTDGGTVAGSSPSLAITNGELYLVIYTTAASAPEATGLALLPDHNISLTVTGAIGSTWSLHATNNLTSLRPWPAIQTGTITSSPFMISDLTATNYPVRFYYFSAP